MVALGCASNFTTSPAATSTTTTAAFDAQHPDGADYVIVPAMTRDDDPEALQWIRSQASKGAIVVGICAGATVVGDSIYFVGGATGPGGRGQTDQLIMFTLP